MWNNLAKQINNLTRQCKREYMRRNGGESSWPPTNITTTGCPPRVENNELSWLSMYGCVSQLLEEGTAIKKSCNIMHDGKSVYNWAKNCSKFYKYFQTGGTDRRKLGGMTADRAALLEALDWPWILGVRV